MLTALAVTLLTIALSYSPPVSYEMSIAGNFGEPRYNHFHGGIDVKTAGVKGKPIYSIADGYVSRVTIGLLGFGRAVYVNHPDGNTSVYCHLEGFSPRINALLKRHGIDRTAKVADIEFKATDCPVSEGQLIAISGNSGASTAPHLHLELHDTRTWRMKDPLTVLGQFIKDTTPPRAHAVMAYPVKGQGAFGGRQAKTRFTISSNARKSHFNAWGRVGFAIWANDYADEAYNALGVKETILKVDGMEVFHSNIAEVPVQSNRMVNTYGDFDYYSHFKRWYIKSFIDKGNELSIVKATGKGIVDFNEERDYNLEYTLRDAYGNTSTYSFIVTGKRTQITPYIDTLQVRADGMANYVHEDVQLIIPPRRLWKDINIIPKTKVIKGETAYTFYPTALPLLQPAELSIYVGEVEDSAALTIATRDERALRTTFHQGWVTAGIRDLGAYYYVTINKKDKDEN